MTRYIDLERLYRDVSPSVVSVYVGRDGPAMGAGSGFVIGDNHVLTNQHVVGGVDDVEPRFSDGSWRTGRVVGTDAYTDLAVIHVDDLPATATPLTVAADNPRPGRQVAALGNPLGLDGSITTGIVSGANRSMATANGFAIPDVVQTDAAINPGNSGGPLVGVVAGTDTLDADGAVEYEVVGVNRARQGDGIGFAVSPTIVNRVVPALIEEGEYRHSYLRTRTLDVTPTVAEANGLDRPRGVLVVDVGDDGNELRGSHTSRTVRGREIPVGGDVILGIEGHEVHTHEELMRFLITETRPGEPVDIDVIREGEPTTLSVVLGERPQPSQEDERRRGRGRRNRRGRRDRGRVPRGDESPRRDDGRDSDDGGDDRDGGSRIPID
ncbi:serine protease, S1-C subfamily, contains C-terminal PDZ domain [Halogranum gelatinilyticum]|uniref:Serine protease, S1-C subfamily, contains C-terminal PDZ domain n=1 Tax=Halogranum gelatinilyticum TaxID=660521 RepID=A0A1G9R878_9EURY|nr:trypsin-like peptidase domain-containing protein [Halogranum gelatinilyticum]SDM19512.1 serine protease, S1-C subfamily, contains C-terminal PDZ domain [Halogranum gelatinilyticum]